MHTANPIPEATVAHLRDLLARGWSYRQIGRVVGLSCGGVHHIVSGRTKHPSARHAEQIAALHATGLSGPYNPNRRHRRETP